MIKLRYKNTNTYFFNGLLIDTDMPDTLPLFFKELKQNGLNISDIKYVLATHYHPDHSGLISQLTGLGIKLILIDRQKDYIHFSDTIFSRIPNLVYQPICEKDAEIITCEESRKFLSDIGISGEIIPTESHSPDGIALISDDGFAFAGDLEPIEYTEIYGEDSPLKHDWDKILSHRVHTVCFGHKNDRKSEVSEFTNKSIKNMR